MLLNPVFTRFEGELNYTFQGWMIFHLSSNFDNSVQYLIFYSSVKHEIAHLSSININWVEISFQPGRFIADMEN